MYRNTVFMLVFLLISTVSCLAQKKYQHIQVLNKYTVRDKYYWLIDTSGLSDSQKVPLKNYVINNHRFKGLNQLFNYLGQQGWELISSPAVLESGFSYWFKKEE